MGFGCEFYSVVDGGVLLGEVKKQRLPVVQLWMDLF
jgi:hypothetical protein